MAIPGSLAARMVAGNESTYNTAVVGARAFEFDTENIKPKLVQVDGPGLRGEIVLLDNRNKAVRQGSSGPVVFTVLSNGFGYWFKHLLGAVATTTLATGGKKHTFTLDKASGNLGQSFTLQAGKPDDAGTIQPHTYSGGKVKSGELNQAMGGPLKLTLDMDFAGEAFPSLIVPSYVADQELFSFAELAVTLDGVALFTRSVKVSIDKMLDVDDWGLGNTKNEPIVGNWVGITGELGLNYNKALYDEYVAGTRSALVLTWTGQKTIPSTSPATKYYVKVSIPKVEFTAYDPVNADTGRIKPAGSFRGLNDLTNEPITIEYGTDDATP